MAREKRASFIRTGNLLTAEHLYSCWWDGEALKCRWRSLSTVTCVKHFNSCRWNEPFQEAHYGVYRPTRQIVDDGSIVASQLLRTRYSSFVWATSPVSSHQLDPCSPFPHHQHTPLLTSCLDLELLFKGMLPWCLRGDTPAAAHAQTKPWGCCFLSCQRCMFVMMLQVKSCPSRKA